jgi:hypothetical protein
VPRARLWYRLPYEGRDGWRAAATQQLGARGWQPASLERAPAPGLDVLAFDVPSLAGLDDLRRELTADRDWREAATRAALAIDDRQAWGLGPLRTQVVAEEAVIVGGTRSGNWMNIDAHDGLPSVLINDIDSLPDGRLCLATYEGLCLFDGTTARRRACCATRTVSSAGPSASPCSATVRSGSAPSASRCCVCAVTCWSGSALSTGCPCRSPPVSPWTGTTACGSAEPAGWRRTTTDTSIASTTPCPRARGCAVSRSGPTTACCSAAMSAPSPGTASARRVICQR